MDEEVDLLADLNAEDDDELGWSTPSDARAPTNVRPGAFLFAGNGYGQAIVRVVTVDADGQVHSSIVPGSVAKNRHLLGTPSSGRARPPSQRQRSLVSAVGTKVPSGCSVPDRSTGGRRAVELMVVARSGCMFGAEVDRLSRCDERSIPVVM